jgi:phospholipase C
MKASSRAVLGCLVAVIGLAPSFSGMAVARASIAKPLQRTATPISHVVVIYQENHSFDETLGYWCNTFTPTRCDGFTGTVKLNDGSTVAMYQSPDVVPNVSHTVRDQVAAMDGGRMDGWEHVGLCSAVYKYSCLTYYTPAQIPNLTALANQFAVSDRTFSMGDSPSWGGHMYAVAASQDGFLGDNPLPAPGITPGLGWGCNSKKISMWVSPTGQKAQEPSCIPDPALPLPYGGAFEATPVPYIPTIMDRLDAAALPWRIYAGGGPGTTGGWTICPTFAECLYTTQNQNQVLPVTVLQDAAKGTLPAFSVVIPSLHSGGVSQHNGQSMLQGDNWIGQVVSAIEKGPNWSSTAIFITYDDCGCFYDHVPPPLNPDGTQQGPRVPMVIVSPWARPAFTDSTPATFASILAFTEHTFGLAPLSANDAGAYDFSNSFNFGQVVDLRPVPMVWSKIPAGEHLIPIDINDPT